MKCLWLLWLSAFSMGVGVGIQIGRLMTARLRREMMAISTRYFNELVEELRRENEREQTLGR